MIKEWISKHKFLWICMLGIFGFIIGLGGMILLNAPLKNGIIMSFTYSIVLICAELTLG